MNVPLLIPAESVEAIAQRAAAIVLEQLGDRAGGEREWLTVAEAAEYIRCQPQRIYELRSDGRLPKHSEGGRALVRRRDLDGLIAGEVASLAVEARRHRLRSA